MNEELAADLFVVTFPSAGPGEHNDRLSEYQQVNCDTRGPERTIVEAYRGMLNSW
jgi:hypothetical protein